MTLFLNGANTRFLLLEGCHPKALLTIFFFICPGMRGIKRRSGARGGRGILMPSSQHKLGEYGKGISYFFSYICQHVISTKFSLKYLHKKSSSKTFQPNIFRESIGEFLPPPPPPSRRKQTTAAEAPPPPPPPSKAHVEPREECFLALLKRHHRCKRDVSTTHGRRRKKEEEESEQFGRSDGSNPTKNSREYK